MSPTRSSTSSSAAPTRVTRTEADREDYKVPLVGVTVPARLVETGFWGGLLGAAALGALDPPLALLVGAGVIVARHRRRS
jgi:hypothetical protein